ncbi:MAG: DUF1501 domain-containing protein [Verrucomicrobiales bacterium]|nr:DUF1501 domain-containing protein [Verrucomicrobiales bacterium]
MQRRNFIKTAGLGGMAMAGMPHLMGAEGGASIPVTFPKGKVEHCIHIWLGGGAAQVDTWDPKAMGDAKAAKKKPGSYYKAIDTAVPGVQVCEHLSRCAGLMDRMTAVRTVNHDVIDEHAAAVNRMHTGRPVSGTTVYPSLGSVVAHERGSVADDVPAYVVIGYPSSSRAPGFLGSKAGFLYLLDTDSGPAGFKRPDGITLDRHLRRSSLLRKMREQAGTQRGELVVKEYDAAIEESQRLSGDKFMKVFDLKNEDANLRESFGGEFGQRCLLARRLIQRGVRFIEVAHNLNFVNGTGWDTHNQGQLNQHVLIEELDRALSTMILDLEKHKLLDKTLIVVNTEFGRPAAFDGGGGRGHQSSAFSVLLAGGGLNHMGAYGVTDELSKKAVENPVSVPDLFATIHASMGINPAKELHDGDRPVPITDMGKPIEALLT